jgi:hypothetical protein
MSTFKCKVVIKKHKVHKKKRVRSQEMSSSEEMSLIGRIEFIQRKDIHSMGRSLFKSNEFIRKV